MKCITVWYEPKNKFAELLNDVVLQFSLHIIGHKGGSRVMITRIQCTYTI